MLKICLILYASCLIVPSAAAQSFLNLDFEYSVYPQQPRKWVIEGEGHYFARVDSTGAAHHGKKVLCLELKSAEAYVFLSLPQNVVKGTTIAIGGFVRSEKFDSLQVMFGFKDPYGAKPTLRPLQNPTNDTWNFIQNEITIPADYNSDRLLIALIVIGSGKVFFDDVFIKKDGNQIGNEHPDFREPTVQQITRLNDCAIPVLLNQKSRTKSFEKLDRAIGNSKVVALGENSHGSAPIYDLKLQFIKYLVEQKGYTLFALESPSAETDAVNDYVIGDHGALDSVLHNLVYPSWKTREMAAIIEWIKKHNRKAKTKVQFRGFDMQDGSEALTRLVNFAQRYDKGLLSTLNTIAIEIKSNHDLSGVYRQVQTLEEYINSKSGNDYPRITNEALSDIKRCAAILRQNIGLKIRVKSRDEYMAENIQWLLLNNSPNQRMIVSADNSHITKISGKMRSFLRADLAGDYLAIGFTFNKGTYAAYGAEKFYEVHPSYVGTYEYLFSKCKFKNFILDLRQPEIASEFQFSRGFRSIGSMPQETTQFSETILSNNFDLIAYIERSTHTEMK